ncbi:MAG: peptidase E [Flavobacteriaceae bacterium]|nr:peptidase E [Flavobacteriaceae bacterium]
MHKYKLVLLILVISFLSFNTLHKYYVSVTEIEYISEQKSLQIISRVFIDDFESTLRNRYDERLTLAVDNEDELVNYYTERYLKEKLKITINGEPIQFNFIGKEYEDDLMLSYLEAVNLNEISTIEVVNRVLFETFPDQKNIVRFKINSTNKSILLVKENDKGLLNL